jgi:hypothetical protein
MTDFISNTYWRESGDEGRVTSLRFIKMVNLCETDKSE